MISLCGDHSFLNMLRDFGQRDHVHLYPGTFTLPLQLPVDVQGAVVESEVSATFFRNLNLRKTFAAIFTYFVADTSDQVLVGNGQIQNIRPTVFDKVDVWRSK